MDNPLTPEQQNILIEDALHTYPLASMPRDLTVDVMARIQTIPAPRPFRLAWSDLILHIYRMIGFRNRILVFVNWAWDYIFYENQIRLITRE